MALRDGDLAHSQAELRRLQRLAETLPTLEAECQALRGHLDQQQREHAGTARDLAALEQHSAELAQDCGGLQAALADCQAHLARSRAGEDALARSSSAAAAELAQVQREQASLVAHNSQLVAQLQQLQAQTRASDAQRVQRLGEVEHELQALQELVEKHDNEALVGLGCRDAILV